MNADPTLELSGAGVRRYTRQATATRADTSWLTLGGDVLSWLTTAGVVVAVLGGAFSALRERIAARPETGTTVLPGELTAVVAAVLVTAGVVALLSRLGPVSATPATAAWWLPLPAGRRGLLRGELRRVGLVAVVAAVVVALPVVLAAPAAPTVAEVAATVAGAALLALAVVGALVVLQAAGRTGWVAPVAGSLATVVVVVPALLGTVAGSWAWEPSAPHLPVPVLLGVPAVLAVAGLVAADRVSDRLAAGALRERGTAVFVASASALSLDTRELGRALGTPVHPPRRTRSWSWVREPWQAVVAADLAVFSRSPWRWGQLAIGAALPVLAARTRGLGEVPALVAVAVVLGWSLAAVALGEPSRRAHGSPAGDRSLPLDARDVVRSRAVVPLVGLVVVCGVSLGLTGLGWEWVLLGVATAPAWAGAAVRGGYRPELDWSGPVLSSPMGAVPTGVGATLVRGLDLGVLGTVPLVVALLLGEVPQLLLGIAVAWSVGLGLVSVETARRSKE
ncbi:hypothetical protein ASG36_08885 [Geodermatophilus sp. Leaf369]|uniref:DUF6297 family protein n=1 Tax=Geodermatophilus sp. Leaf369 TaxID=1736354 RepID=UPI0006FF6881|nr:DUF6297 family protein [Geodermatophilus sp. Leaf369]KQS58226.1 hypothetical protein ASG36_08885 [Geodermatophilus sp. Leaf369]